MWYIVHRSIDRIRSDLNELIEIESVREKDTLWEESEPRKERSSARERVAMKD